VRHAADLGAATSVRFVPITLTAAKVPNPSGDLAPPSQDEEIRPPEPSAAVRAPQTASVNPQIHFGSEAIGLLLNPLYQLFLRHVVDCRFVVHVDVGRFVLPEPAPVEQASYHGHTVLKWWPTITPSRKARPQAHGSFIAWLLWADEQVTPRPVADPGPGPRRVPTQI